VIAWGIRALNRVRQLPFLLQLCDHLRIRMAAPRSRTPMVLSTVWHPCQNRTRALRHTRISTARPPRSGVLRGPTPATTDQTFQVESCQAWIPGHPSSGNLNAEVQESLERAGAGRQRYDQSGRMASRTEPIVFWINSDVISLAMYISYTADLHGIRALLHTNICGVKPTLRCARPERFVDRQ
jgi:hypothetical protein